MGHNNREREKQKHLKYQNLGADLCAGRPGWVCDINPVVVGCLGSIGKLETYTLKKEELHNSTAGQYCTVRQSLLLWSCYSRTLYIIVYKCSPGQYSS